MGNKYLLRIVGIFTYSRKQRKNRYRRTYVRVKIKNHHCVHAPKQRIISVKLGKGEGDGREFFRKRQFFFTTEHCQGVSSGDYGEPLPDTWVARTTFLDAYGYCAPCPGLEDEEMDSVDKLIFAYHSFDQLIPNPDPRFEIPELYHRYPMLHDNTARVPRPNNCAHLDRSSLTAVQRKILALLGTKVTTVR